MAPSGDSRKQGIHDEAASHRIFGYDLSQHPSHIQLSICVTGVVVLYLFYGYFQELIFKVEGFKFGWYLTFVQFIIYSVLASLDTVVAREYARRAPLKNYLAISFFMVLTMGLSNTSLQYLNYPTQLLFKSCKIIPVMIGGVVLLRKRYSGWEYLSAVLLSLGLIELTFGNAYSDGIHFNLLGTGIICCALFADAFIGNFQEGTLTQYNVSSREMALYSHMMGSVQLFIVLVLVGQLVPAFSFCWENPVVYLYIFLFSACGYVGANFVLVTIKLFGAFLATTITSCRKFITLILSFFIFPKPFTIHYAIATMLVVLGICAHIYAKNMELVDNILSRLFGFGKSNRDMLPTPATQQREAHAHDRSHPNALSAHHAHHHGDDEAAHRLSGERHANGSSNLAERSMPSHYHNSAPHSSHSAAGSNGHY